MGCPQKAQCSRDSQSYKPVVRSWANKLLGVTAAQPPLEGPFGGALKKVYVAVTSGRISHGCLAGVQWTVLGGVGRCVARVRHA